jgi:hypothetical protein
MAIFFRICFSDRKSKNCNIGEKEGEGTEDKLFPSIPSQYNPSSPPLCRSVVTFINLLLQSSRDVRRRERFKFLGL